MRKILIALSILILIAGGVWWFSRGSQIAEHHPAEKIVPRTQNVNELSETVPSGQVSLTDGAVFDLVMRPVSHTIAGRTIALMGYNGSVPGPTFRVKQGSAITLRLHNETESPTTLHAHGVRMENAFDGVPGLTQTPVNFGQVFEYKLTFPDVGAFWYHPHVRTDFAVESGLYGMFVVEPSDAHYWPQADRTLPIMVDDIALSESGLVPFDEKVATHTLMGRFGNVMFTNGSEMPNFPVQQGEIVRLMFTNAANTRLFNLQIPGIKFKLIGADGGKYAEESWIQELLLAPGERRIVDVLFEKSGSYTLTHLSPEEQYPLGKFVVTANSVDPQKLKNFQALRPLDENIKNEFRSLFSMHGTRDPDKSIRLSMKMNSNMNMQGGMPHRMHMMSDGTLMSNDDMGMGGEGDAYEWEDTMSMMNTHSTSDTTTWQIIDQSTNKVNMDINNWAFRVGDMVKIRIFNDPRSMHPMQHPIHFHGQRFVVLSTNGVANTAPVWVDTVLIAKGDTVDILLETSNPGKWMAHCHILEHAESGMMFPFSVVE